MASVSGPVSQWNLPSSRASRGIAPRWSHHQIKLNLPSHDRDHLPLPPDLKKIETVGIEEGILEISCLENSVTLTLATPENTGHALASALEEAYHGDVYTLDEEGECPFTAFQRRDDLHFVAGKARVPGHHVVDIGGWTHDLPPRTTPPPEWDLSTALYRNLEGWKRRNPRGQFLIYEHFRRTGGRERSLGQHLLSPEEKIELRARGWVPEGPAGIFGHRPPQKGSEPTQLDLDYLARYTQRRGWPIYFNVERAGVVTEDARGFVEALNGWASQVQYRTKSGRGPLFSFGELGYGLFKGEKKKRRLYSGWARAFEGHSFLPGVRRKGYGNETSRECFKTWSVPYEKRLLFLADSYHLEGTRDAPPLPARASPVPVRPTPTRAMAPLPPAPSQVYRPTTEFQELQWRRERKAGIVSRPAEPARAAEGCPLNYSEREKRWGRLSHDPGMVCLLGQTGMGKSTSELNIFLYQLRHTPPSVRFVLVDAPGTLIEDVKACLTPEEARQVVEVDLDPDHFFFSKDGHEMVTVPFNLLHIPGRDRLGKGAFERQRDIVIGNLIQLLRGLRPPSRNEDAAAVGQRMEHIYRSLLPGLMERSDTNLYDLILLLSKNRQAMEAFHCTVQTAVSHDYVEEMRRLPADYFLSSRNPVGTIVDNSILAGVLCQRERIVDLGEMVSNHRVVLVNLRKGKASWDLARILGSIFITEIGFHVLQGERTTEPSLFLFVDEWHNFVTPTFATLLSEGAKYGLRLVLANQYVNQIPEEIRDSVKQNIHTWGFFGLGPGDARFAAEVCRSQHFGVAPDDFYRFPRGYAGFRIGSDFVVGSTVPPPPQNPPEIRAIVEKIILQNTRAYSTEERSRQSPYLADGKATPSRWNGHGGDPHDVLIAQVMSLLKSLDFDPKEPRQGPREVAPDIIHVEAGAIVHDEIETDASHPDQVRTNLEKAFGKFVVFWTPNETVARRVAHALEGRSGYRIMVRDEAGGFAPMKTAPRADLEPPNPQPGGTRPGTPAEALGLLRGHLSGKYDDLVRVGKTLDTPKGKGVLPLDLVGSETGLGEERRGRILHALGYVGIRAWDPVAKKKVMVYVRLEG